MALLPPLKRWLVNGLIITIPLVITIMVLLLVLNFLVNALTPVVDGIALVWADEPSPALIRTTTVVSVLLLFLIVGIVAEYTPGSPVIARLDRLMSTIPLVGTIYSGAQQASDILVDDSADQFRDVKLVQFPTEGTYILGFVTATQPEAIESAVGSSPLTTIMVPLAPNPVTNGVILHVPDDRMWDVDLSIEEAIQAIMSLGMALEENEDREVDR